MFLFLVSGINQMRQLSVHVFTAEALNLWPYIIRNTMTLHFMKAKRTVDFLVQVPLLTALGH
jgi:hypothetical protein